MYFLSGVCDPTELFRRLKREEKCKSCPERVDQSNVVLSCFTRIKFIGVGCGGDDSRCIDVLKTRKKMIQGVMSQKALASSIRV